MGSCKVGRGLQTHEMGSLLSSEEKPLAQTKATNENKNAIFFEDQTCPQKFKDFKFKRLEEQMPGPQCEQIKENFRELAEQVNGTMEEEYEEEDRLDNNNKRNVMVPLMLVVFLAVVLGLLGICLLKPDAPWSYWYPIWALLILLGLLLVTTVCCYGTSEMDSRVGQHITSIIEQWNMENEHHRVFAEFIENHLEHRGNRNVWIPPTLNLLKIKDADL